MDPFRSRTAVVTGATKGIGRALAEELTARGARVILVARSRADLDALAATLPGSTPIAADLGTGADGLLEALAGQDVDLLVNNAGIGAVGPFLGGGLDRHLRSIDLNVTALTTLTYGLGRRMAERGSGGIVNVASTAAFQPLPYQATYAATKAYVLSFSEALAEELRPAGVRVMAAHPGATATGFFDHDTATIDPRVADTPARVAAAILDDYARGRAASYPGRAAFRAMTWTSRFVPRALAARVAAAFNRKAGLHLSTELAA